MILNFYLRKNTPPGRFRDCELKNFAKVKSILQSKGIQNVQRLDYHEANQLLAKLVAAEIIGKA